MAEPVDQVRPATPDDAAGLRALGEAVVPPTYGPIDPGYAEWCLDQWWDEDGMRRQLEAGVQHVVAVEGDRVVGVANLAQHESRWVMWKLYVHPEHQGGGTGRALLEAVAERVPAGEPLWLEYVDGNTRAAAFYARHGFEESHRERNERFPDTVWMRRDGE